MKVGQIIFFGFALLVAWLALYYVGSLFVDPNRHSPNVGNPFVAIAMGLIAYSIARRLRPRDGREALMIGASWCALLVGLLLAITIPNGTTDRFFGAWTIYLVYLAIFMAPLLAYGLIRPRA